MFARFRSRLSTIIGALSRALARQNIVWPWDIIVSRHLIDMNAQKVKANSNSKSLRIFALSPNRFMADLKILAAQDGYEVITLRVPWQGVVSSIFADRRGQKSNGILLAQRFEKPMQNFLRAFFIRNGVDIVLSACVWYKQDVVWGSMAQKIGVPYIVLHRESLKTQPEHQKWVTETVRKFGDENGFLGQNLIFHNQPMCELMTDIGFASTNQVVNGGCLRMDGFVNKVLAGRNSAGQSVAIDSVEEEKRPQVTLFSFATGIGLNGLISVPFPMEGEIGWFRLFDVMHGTFARLAHERPDVDFIIKPKWDSYWLDWINKAIKADGLDPDAIENLTITSTANPHDLILDSDVICGFASTVLLEAGIAGKPVVIPDFEETLEPIYRERVQLRQYNDLFDIANSAEAFTDLIEQRLENQTIAKETLSQRDEAFTHWISNMKGNAVDQYTKTFDTAADWGAQKRLG
ncbi:MAG: glycosyltransferase [Rhodospirillaceae bacterium]|jgi:hypothetical protein|nr:glycosyltransferase [Rhodospirillaceae bacterium]MBT5881868.1 glycosyltransferase [Rhodospirillaceae bacterium]MBT6587573.1 glycosyltransferase [Rhodospirillaceae bacterium]